MERCLQLAAMGAGYTSPNPLVGAVLVHEGRIIGEGWHQRFGGPHAEIECLQSVPDALQHLIPQSTLYVSLEPCAHHGKTPPCSLRIIQERIPEVVVGLRDPFPEVDGKGIQQLEAAGVRVTTGVLQHACAWQNRRFITRILRRRPYIVLKWAETADGKIAAMDGKPLAISGAVTNRLVHRWRSEEAAILVGRRTVETDDPQLTNRLWTGPSPVRIVADRQLSLSRSQRIFQPDRPVIVWNARREGKEDNLQFVHAEGDDPGPFLEQMAAAGIDSILVEGGQEILLSFMHYGYVDEIRHIQSTRVQVPRGIPAPALSLPPDRAFQVRQSRIGDDIITYFEAKDGMPVG